MRYILKASIFILITAESVCILTAEIVDLILYNHSLLLSIPLALIAGAFTVEHQRLSKNLDTKIILAWEKYIQSLNLILRIKEYNQDCQMLSIYQDPKS